MRPAAIALMTTLTAFTAVLTLHLLPAHHPVDREARYAACMASTPDPVTFDAIDACVVLANKGN